MESLTPTMAVNMVTPMTTVMFLMGLVIITGFFISIMYDILDKKVSVLKILLLSPPQVYLYMIYLIIAAAVLISHGNTAEFERIDSIISKYSWMSEICAFAMAIIISIFFSKLKKNATTNERKILIFAYMICFEISSVFSYVHSTVTMAILFSIVSSLAVGLAMKHYFAKDIKTLMNVSHLFNKDMMILPVTGSIITITRTVTLFTNKTITPTKQIDNVMTYQNLILGLAITAFCFIVTHLIAKTLINVDANEKKNIELNITNNNLIEANAKINKITIEMLDALVNTIEAKDEYTNGHSLRVAKYSRLIAVHMGMTKEEADHVYMCGLLHDIGKIAIPDAIINKPGKLTDDEFDVIKSHPQKGFTILEAIDEISDIQQVALSHHERIDGKGYPNRLTGDQLPTIVKIVSIADSYDAMTSKRSYRPPMEQAAVRAEIEKGLNTQFDETIGRIMLAIIDEDTEYELKQET